MYIIHSFHNCACFRLPRYLKASPLRMGDEILEINGVPIVDQDQTEVHVRNFMCVHVCMYITDSSSVNWLKSLCLSCVCVCVCAGFSLKHI